MKQTKARLKAVITRRSIWPPLVFMHVPKTAGTQMIEFLDNELRPRIMARPFGRSIFGDWNEYSTMAERIRQKIIFGKHDIPKNADVVAGHVDLSTLESISTNSLIFTVLREPRARLISHFLYWRSINDSGASEYGSWSGRITASRQSLKNFLSLKDAACQTDNLFVRMLLFPNKNIPSFDFINYNHDSLILALATKKIGNFHYIDIISNPLLFHNLREWMRGNYGRTIWSSVKKATIKNSSVHANEAGTNPNYIGLDIRREAEEASALLDQSTRLDRALWHRVVQDSMPSDDPNVLAEKVYEKTLARYESIIARSSTGSGSR